MIDRDRRLVERLIKTARFPTYKSLDTFDFLALPSLKNMLVLKLARSNCVERRENIIAVGNSGRGKSHVELELGLAAYLPTYEKQLSVGLSQRRLCSTNLCRPVMRSRYCVPTATQNLQAFDHR